MAGYKEPGFQDRVATAQRAREAALEKLRSKKPLDEAEVARRIAAQQAKEVAAAEKRERVAREREEAKVAKAEATRLAEEAAAAAKPTELTDEEKKAARDARYAARKNRKR